MDETQEAREDRAKRIFAEWAGLHAEDINKFTKQIREMKLETGIEGIGLLPVVQSKQTFKGDVILFTPDVSGEHTVTVGGNPAFVRLSKPMTIIDGLDEGILSHYLEHGRVLTMVRRVGEADWTRLVIEEEGAEETREGFSTNYLAKTVLPYVEALIEIQRVMDEIRGVSGNEVKVLGISQGSVTVDLTGGIRDSIELVRDMVVPWRRENQRKLAERALAEKELGLTQKRVEVAAAKAAVKRADGEAESEGKRTEAEAEKLRAEAGKLRAEALTVEAQARQVALANQQTELELVGLALEMVRKIKPDVGEAELLMYAMKMVDPVRVIARSPLALVDAQYFLGGRDDRESGVEEKGE